MFLLFLTLCASLPIDVLAVTPENNETVIGGSQAAFLKFYSPKCKHCIALAEDFAVASSAFPTVTFGGVDCLSYPDLCSAYRVAAWPTLYLFLAGSKEPIPFPDTASRSFDGFCDFVEKQTGIKARRSTKVFTNVNPLTLNETIAATKCLFLTYYQFWDGHAKVWLPEAKAVAIAFLGEPTVSIGLLNCPVYVDFCETHMGWNAIPPRLKLYLNGTEINYDGERESEAVVDFLNEQCGTQRLMSGFLNDEAGLVNGTEEIVREFLANPEQADQAIEKMKAVKGAEFYVTVMKRFLSGGIELIQKDIEKLSDTLILRKGSWPTLDSIKKRLNVFKLFVVKPPAAPVEDCGDQTDKCTPEPTPSPTPAAEENCSEEEQKCYPPEDGAL